MAAKKSKAHAPNVVVVPEPAAGSYNPHRPLHKNTLLLNQVRHFQEVEATLPEHRRSGHADEVRTEGEAAEYIRKVTKILHPQTHRAGGK